MDAALGRRLRVSEFENLYYLRIYFIPCSGEVKGQRQCKRVFSSSDSKLGDFVRVQKDSSTKDCGSNSNCKAATACYYTSFMLA
jgi:hypothetical protein